MRRILGTAPARHVDIASRTVLARLLSAVLPVTFYDCRPLSATLENLTCEQGNIVDLGIPSDSVPSLSCLHVAEHIGLGRYGDPIDPEGTRRAGADPCAGPWRHSVFRAAGGHRARLLQCTPHPRRTDDLRVFFRLGAH